MDSNSLPSTSSSSPPNHHHHHRHLQTRFKVTQPVADRIVRALRHRLRLLHRSGPDFYVLGATANVYTVSLSSTATACTCPDRTSPCKHILFVLIRALRVPLSHPSLRRRSLRPCHLARLLASPTAPESLAGPALREKFHQLFFGANNNNRHHHHDHLPQKPAINDVDNVEDGATCPVCLEEMVEKERVVACGTCRNPVHEECLLRWKRSSGRRSASCVICRARWRDHHHHQQQQQQHQERYLNLSAYVSEEEEAAAGGGGGGDDGLCVDLARLRGRLD